MENFGVILGRLVVEITLILEGTFGHFVNITFEDGNITSVELTSLGDVLCENWSNLLVSFAGFMNVVLSAMWTTTSG